MTNEDACARNGRLGANESTAAFAGGYSSWPPNHEPLANSHDPSDLAKQLLTLS